MADNSGGGNSALAMLVGVLLVAVVVLGFFMYSGGHFGNNGTNLNVPSHVNVDINGPKPGGG